MDVKKLTDALGADFFTGVPDSQLKALCDRLMDAYGTDPKHHIIAANEGNAIALATGYHLATGKVPVVYLQNSGLGNVVNPMASLLNRKVYGIPCILIVGWRGEPGVRDEPQHAYQGEVTLRLLEDMEVPYFIVSGDTDADGLPEVMGNFRQVLAEGRQAAFVIRKNALTYDRPGRYENQNRMPREDAIGQIVQAAGGDIIVSTTGKTSRELFEIRESRGEDHGRDFLTVGSMGHCSSIALGIALQRPEARVWCLDGDGAALMHLGAMALIGANRPANLVHIVLNNEAHESVGGMPTVAGALDLPGIARACGYQFTASAENEAELAKTIEQCRAARALSFLEVKCAIGSRPELGRPTTLPIKNKQVFMKYLAEECRPHTNEREFE